LKLLERGAVSCLDRIFGFRRREENSPRHTKRVAVVKLEKLAQSGCAATSAATYQLIFCKFAHLVSLSVIPHQVRHSWTHGRGSVSLVFAQ